MSAPKRPDPSLDPRCEVGYSDRAAAIIVVGSVTIITVSVAVIVYRALGLL